MPQRTPRWTPHGPILDISPHLTAHHPHPARLHVTPTSHPPVADVHPGLGAARSRPIRTRIAANSARGTATSASWNVTTFAWRTTFAPILISFSRSVVSVHARTERGRASCLRKFPRL